MKILHFHTGTDSMITQYVTMLADAMKEYAEVYAASTLISFRKQLHKHHPDIVHIHGCWSFQTAAAAYTATSKHVRIVFTPHGQLELWVMKQDYWKEKLPKTLAFQRRVVSWAYAVIAMGRMEENNLKRMKWNTRIETVRNPLVTDSITVAEAGTLIFAIYQKVMDTNVLQLMDKTTAGAIRPLIKAGLTGDHLWLSDTEYNIFRNPEDISWHKIMVYSAQENILETIRRGISALGINVTDFSPETIPHYLPDNFIPSHPISAIDSNDANKRMVAMIEQARKYASTGRLTIYNMVELTSALLRNDINDDKVKEQLSDKSLLKFAGRLMKAAADMTGLDEGFMPVKAIDDKKTNKIKSTINKHLEI
ncbi:MAG: glycosyltransferase [Prevotella sp.]|nr:glycosyltransferase [Prevotella sp.]